MNLRSKLIPMLKYFRKPSTIFLATFALVLVLPIFFVSAEKTPTVDKLVEFAIQNYGGRPAIFTIQKNGIVKNNLKLINGENIREGRTTTKFIRKPKSTEDLVILELDLPETKFTMGFDGEKSWATNNGEKAELSPELSNAFRTSYTHGYEALLRYKEDGGKVEFVETKKMASLEIDVIDLTAADGTKTRYEVSRRTGRILQLEYETKGVDGNPTKYRLLYQDFKIVQNSVVVPYKTVVYENGTKVEERTIIEAAYGVQLEEKVFKPDAPATVEAKKETTPEKP
jgi:hypothetical protein